MNTFIKETELSAPASKVFEWHLSEGAFERLAAPWENVEIVERTGSIADGGRVKLKIGVGPFSSYWTAQHEDFVPGESFRDRQIAGPFRQWLHIHSVEPLDDESCLLRDEIQYELPFGMLGDVFGSSMIERKLKRLFDYRHRLMAEDTKAHFNGNGKEKTMHIAVTGSTGLVGSSLIPFLTTGGHRVSRLVRKRDTSEHNSIYWKPSAGEIDKNRLEGLEGVVHLAGENIAGGRWTEAKKKRIRDSRVLGTKLLCEALAGLNTPPKVLVAASAIGYYGDRGSEMLTEESAGGSGFLNDVCAEWEAATKPAEQAGIRVVNVRIGIVLSPRGGALAKMLLPFKMGVGGVIGDGSQYMSWISLDDLIGIFHHALQTESLHGPVNAVAPNPVTNREFTKTLGKVLGRPTVLPLPAFAAKLAFGEMGEDLLLASTRVEPKRLRESGYEFRHEDLESALRHELGK